MTWNSTTTRTHWPLTWKSDGTPDLYFDRPDQRFLRIPLSRPVPLTVALMNKGQRYQVRVSSWRTGEAEADGLVALLVRLRRG